MDNQVSPSQVIRNLCY